MNSDKSLASYIRHKKHKKMKMVPLGDPKDFTSETFAQYCIARLNKDIGNTKDPSY